MGIKSIINKRKAGDKSAGKPFKKAKTEAPAPSKKSKKQQKKEESDKDELEVSGSEDELDQQGGSDDESGSSNWGSDSEDEDNSDNEEQENGASANGEQDSQEKPEGLLSSKESHAKQKKVKEERKMARPNADAIQSVKKLWERLRVKKGLNAPTRQKLVKEAWAMSKGLVCDIALKHDTSRVVQTMVKYSDKKIRKEITDELKPIFYTLATSNYGKYLIIKLLHYGDQKTRDEICEALFSKGVAGNLMRHRHGAYVLEDLFRYYASPKYKSEIINEFFDTGRRLYKKEEFESLEELLKANPEKRPDMMAHAYRRIQAAVEKGSVGFNVIHAVMLNYVKNMYTTTSEKDNFVDLITEQIAEIVHTPEGSETASRVLAISSAKERRQLMKSFRKFIFELASDENGCFVLITLFNTVDDTVLVKRAFSDTLAEQMPGLLTSKSGRKAFLYLLLGPSTRYFSKDQIAFFNTVNELKQATSKKNDDERRRENLVSFSPFMLKTIEDYPRRIFQDTVGSQTAVEVLLYAATVKGEDEDSDKLKALRAVANTFKGDITAVDENNQSLFSQPFVSRALRTLIQGGHWNASKKAIDPVEDAEVAQFKYLLAAAITDEDKYVAEWATGDGSFVVVGLLELLEKKSDEYKKLHKALKKIEKKIAAAAETNKGSKILAGLL